MFDVRTGKLSGCVDAPALRTHASYAYYTYVQYECGGGERDVSGEEVGLLRDLRRVEVVVEVEVYELWVETRKPRERLCIAMAGRGRCICGIGRINDGFM
jgi:hypothetical protein